MHFASLGDIISIISMRAVTIYYIKYSQRGSGLQMITVNQTFFLNFVDWANDYVICGTIPTYDSLKLYIAASAAE